jgi:hypothetical protein
MANVLSATGKRVLGTPHVDFLQLEWTATFDATGNVESAIAVPPGVYTDFSFMGIKEPISGSISPGTFEWIVTSKEPFGSLFKGCVRENSADNSIIWPSGAQPTWSLHSITEEYLYPPRLIATDEFRIQMYHFQGTWDATHGYDITIQMLTRKLTSLDVAAALS